jgi:hypothetical protein
LRWAQRWPVRIAHAECGKRRVVLQGDRCRIVGAELQGNVIGNAAVGATDGEGIRPAVPLALTVPELQRKSEAKGGKPVLWLRPSCFRPEWEAQRVIEVAGAKMLSMRRSALPEEVFDVIADEKAMDSWQIGFSKQIS